MVGCGVERPGSSCFRDLYDKLVSHVFGPTGCSMRGVILITGTTRVVLSYCHLDQANLSENCHVCFPRHKPLCEASYVVPNDATAIRSGILDQGAHIPGTRVMLRLISYRELDKQMLLITSSWSR